MLGANKAKVKVVSAETYFRQNYVKEVLTLDDFNSAIDRCIGAIKKVSSIPLTYTIQHYEDYRRPSFANFNVENESKPFYEASMAVSGFIALLSLDYFQENSAKFVSQISGKIQEDWPDSKRCPILQNIVRAGFGIASGVTEFIEKYFTPETINFIGKVMLLQSSLSRTKSYQLILEVFGKVFVIKPIVSCREKIQQFIQNEKDSRGKGLFVEESSTNSPDFSDFLTLVTIIARMYKRTDFARHFYNLANDLLNPSDIDRDPYVAVYLSLLASLAVDKEMAEAIYDTLVKLSLYNVQHFLRAIQGYVNDFKQAQANIAKLSVIDSFTLEAKLDLLAQLFKHSEFCRNEINNAEVTVESQSPGDTLVNNLFSLIHSVVPATLKARCFDVLSALAREGPSFGVTWSNFESTEILTQDQIEANSGGIISDIEITETQERSYPLMRSFLRFISYLMSRNDDVPSVELTTRIHTFLLENCLMSVNGRLYNHFNEKWSILCEVTQAWTNMFLHSEETYTPLMRSVLCDQRIVRAIITPLCEDDCPLETLLCAFRLFCAIAEHEDSFIKHMDSSDHSSFVQLAQQISWSSDILKKLILSIGENDRDLQMCSISLSQYIATNAADIAQVVFSRANPRNAFIRVLNVDEEENDMTRTNEELTVRVRLLNFLVSLGESSYFVRTITGYDTSDPPTSLLHSTLEKGILKKLLEKMDIKNQNRNDFPRFIASALQLMLLLCNHMYTIGPLLNLLRSSEHSFFDKQLKSLQDKNSSMKAIGSFLQLLSREATDSIRSTSNTTIQVVQMLMGTEGFGDKRDRIILVFEFVDRIDSSDDAVCIAIGLFEACVAFISNSQSLELMKKWHETWTHFVLLLLGKCITVTNPLTTKYLTQTCGFVARFLFAENSFGPVSEQSKAEIFSESIKALIRLQEMMHNESKMGIFTLISSMFARGQPSDLIKSIYHEFNHEVTNALVSDINIEPPAARAAVFACAEALISLADDNTLNEFIEAAIEQLPSDWATYEEDNERGAFIILSKLSLFTRYLSTPNRNPTIFSDSSIVTHLGYQPFWESIVEAFSTSTVSEISEIKLRTAANSLRVIATLMIAAPKSKNVKEEVDNFLSTFQEPFKAVISFGGYFTLEALSFINSLCCFLALIDDVLPVELMTKLNELKFRFEKSERWRELLRKKAGKTRVPSQKTYAIAMKYIKKLIMVVDQIEGNN